MVIIVRPLGDSASGMIEAEEQALVEQLVPHPAVEALNITVLHRFARRDVVPLDLMVFRPGKDGVRGEFRAVVGDDHAGFATAFDQRCQLAGNTTAGDRGAGDRRQAFARHVVDDVEHAEGKLVMHKVQRALAFASTRIGARVPTARRRALRLRTERPSSR